MGAPPSRDSQVRVTAARRAEFGRQPGDLKGKLVCACFLQHRSPRTPVASAMWANLTYAAAPPRRQMGARHEGERAVCDQLNDDAWAVGVDGQRQPCRHKRRTILRGCRFEGRTILHTEAESEQLRSDSDRVRPQPISPQLLNL